MKPNRPVVCALALCAGSLLLQSPAQADSIRKAKATLNGCADPTVNVGTAFLFEVPSAEAVKIVEVFISVRGLTPGKHAVHIHANGACTNSCGDAGSHLDLGPDPNNPATLKPRHRGPVKINRRRTAAARCSPPPRGWRSGAGRPSGGRELSILTPTAARS
jgi:Cu/Zn superoxide dismutase